MLLAPVPEPCSWRCQPLRMGMARAAPAGHAGSGACSAGGEAGQQGRWCKLCVHTCTHSTHPAQMAGPLPSSHLGWQRVGLAVVQAAAGGRLWEVAQLLALTHQAAACSCQQEAVGARRGSAGRAGAGRQAKADGCGTRPAWLPPVPPRRTRLVRLRPGVAGAVGNVEHRALGALWPVLQLHVQPCCGRQDGREGARVKPGRALRPRVWAASNEDCCPACPARGHRHALLAAHPRRARRAGGRRCSRRGCCTGFWRPSFGGTRCRTAPSGPVGCPGSPPQALAPPRHPQTSAGGRRLAALGETTRGSDVGWRRPCCRVSVCATSPHAPRGSTACTQSGTTRPGSWSA